MEEKKNFVRVSNLTKEQFIKVKLIQKRLYRNNNSLYQSSKLQILEYGAGAAWSRPNLVGAGVGSGTLDLWLVTNLAASWSFDSRLLFLLLHLLNEPFLGFDYSSGATHFLLTTKQRKHDVNTHDKFVSTSSMSTKDKLRMKLISAVLKRGERGMLRLRTTLVRIPVNVFLLF